MTEPSIQDSTPTVYRHAEKPEWGFAMVAWEQEGRRGYQFEDGALRVFKDGYYQRLEAVDTTADRLAALVAMVREVGGSPVDPAAGPDPRSVTLDEQIDYFFAAYPGGFVGEPWRDEHRRGAKRSLKRHRDPAIEIAQRELSSAALDACLGEGRARDGVVALSTVLAATDLVAAGQVRPLAEVGPDGARALITSLRQLLWDGEPPSTHFPGWIKALSVGCGRMPTWELATAPLALVHPGDHLCIRPATFQAQATWMAPQLRLGTAPRASVYSRTLAMAQAVRARIGERGAVAVDLLDIHDFIGLTRSIKARGEIREVRSAAHRADA